MAGIAAETVFWAMYRVNSDSRLLRLPLDIKRYILAPMILHGCAIRYRDARGYMMLADAATDRCYINGEYLGTHLLECWYKKSGWIARRGRRDTLTGLVWFGRHGEYKWDIEHAGTLLAGDGIIVANDNESSTTVHIHLVFRGTKHWKEMPFRVLPSWRGYDRTVGYDPACERLIRWNGDRGILVAGRDQVSLYEFQYAPASVCYSESFRDVIGVTSWGYVETLRAI